MTFLDMISVHGMTESFILSKNPVAPFSSNHLDIKYLHAVALQALLMLLGIPFLDSSL